MNQQPPVNNVMLGLTAFYNPHPAGSGGQQTRTQYWCDYLRDATLQKFTADAVGSYVQRASAAQVHATERLGLQFQSSISQLTSTISSGLSDINHSLSIVSDRLGAMEQSQKATNMLLGNVAQLLRIPDSEKQRQLHIEMGLKFLSNAKHDDDLFKDALDEFKKAEELRPQDFFVLQKIGMIHLYVPSLISLSSAADYLTRSGKYAAVESHADSVRSPQPLAKDPKQDFSEQPNSQPQENAVIGAESYIAASRAQYALGNHAQAFELAQKAVKLQPFMPAALLQQGKCAAATSQPKLAADSFRTAIRLRPGVGVLAAGDLDFMAVPEVTIILGELRSTIPNLIKHDLPFDSKEIEYLRQLPKAAVLQQAWHIIGKSGACVVDQWRPLEQAIREEKASYDEILIFTTRASKFIFPCVTWGQWTKEDKKEWVEENGPSKPCGAPINLTGVIAIAVGYIHTVALKQDGTVAAWGENSSGECDIPKNLTGVIAIAAGYSHTVALKQDGTVAAWGGNSSGQCNVPENLTGVIAIAVGYIHTVALKQDGTVAAWGENSSGQCDLPSYLTGVTAIAAGGQHTVALKQDGTVYVCGSNNYKQCDVPKNLSGVVAIAAGVRHTVALKQDGTVAAWGDHSDKQCDVPKNLNGVTAIAAGVSHTVALKRDGTVGVWGSNNYKQCDVPINLTGVVAIAARDFTTTALIFQQPDVMATDLALRFFKLGCALVAAADGQISSKEQHWLELHLGQGSDAEIMSLITQHGPDGIQQELQKIAANLSPGEKSWLHCGAWQFGDLAGADGLADEENAAIAFILNACGWYQLPEWLQAKLWQA